MKKLRTPRRCPWGSALVAAGLLTLTGCGDSSGRVSIRIVGEALPPLEALDDLSREYSRTTGVEVIVEQARADIVHDKVMADIAAGAGRGVYDIVLQPHKHLGRLVANDYLLPLAPLAGAASLATDGFNPSRDLFPTWWREISTYGDSIYGYPFTALTMYMWYRKDLFEDPDERQAFRERYGYELQVPEYWDQYRDVAEFFTRRDEGLYGTALQGGRGDPLWYEFLNFLYSFGGNIMDVEHGWEYGDIVINSPEAVAALEFYTGLLPFSPPGTLEYTWDDALAVMQQGQAAMVIMWNDATYAVEYSDASTVGGRMGFARVPKSRVLDKWVGQLEGWSYHIPRSSPHPTEAEAFINWMMKRDNQVAQHLNGGASARRDVYDDPRVRALTYTQASVETMEVAIPKPTIPEGVEMTQDLTLALSEALAGTKSAEQALDEVALRYGDLLRGKASLRYPVRQ